MFRVNSSGASGDRRHASFRTDASENSTILDDLKRTWAIYKLIINMSCDLVALTILAEDRR